MPAEPAILTPEPTTEFRTIARRPAVANQTIDTIKAMIVRGELRAGQRLPAQRDLAARLGVSRPSLREAIQALMALNILESRHGEGTFVSSLEPMLLAEPIDFLLQVNASSLIALFEARRALEAAVASLAAQRATDLELSRLDDFVKAGRRDIVDADTFVEHDIEFHVFLREYARSPILASLLESVNLLSYAGRRQAARSEEARTRALSDHESMVKVLKTRDPEAAHKAMVDHLETVLERLKASQAGQ
jgi:GntR family transcriptional repressor for pyruvate dehydrogenase complex